eukprot:Partr_v1_DN25796_c0_g1_i1_m74399 putative Transcription factor
MNAHEYAQKVEQLKLFLAMAPANWSDPNERIKKFHFSNNEAVSCVLWNSLFFITGTDIVKCLVFRFEAIGRPVTNMKKFEEGIFSDLRNLKSGQDAALEEPRSQFLEFLYKNNCIRTQKKQKVFYWYSVPHDRVFLDALERDLKREAMGQETATTRLSALGFQQPTLAAQQPNPSNAVMMHANKQMSLQLSASTTPEHKPSQISSHTSFIDDSDFSAHPSPDNAPYLMHSSHVSLASADILTSAPSPNQQQQHQQHQHTIMHQPYIQHSQQAMITPTNNNSNTHKHLTPTSNQSSPNLIAIAPRNNPGQSPMISPPALSTIHLEGSPHYKKQRRRSSMMMRMAYAKPYDMSARRQSQPMLPMYNPSQQQQQPLAVKKSQSLNQTAGPYVTPGSTPDMVPHVRQRAGSVDESIMMHQMFNTDATINKNSALIDTQDQFRHVRSNSVVSTMSEADMFADLISFPDDSNTSGEEELNLGGLDGDLDISSLQLDTMSFAQMMETIPLSFV